MKSSQMFTGFFLMNMCCYSAVSENKVTNIDESTDFLDDTLFQLENTFLEMILYNRKQISGLQDEILELRYLVQEQAEIVDVLKRTVAVQNEKIMGIQHRQQFNAHYSIPTPRDMTTVTTEG